MNTSFHHPPHARTVTWFNRQPKAYAHTFTDRFSDFGNMVDLGSGSQHEISEPQILDRSHCNRRVRLRLTVKRCGIRPESLPPAEDVKKVERRIASDEKKALQDPDTLEGA